MTSSFCINTGSREADHSFLDLILLNMEALSFDDLMMTMDNDYCETSTLYPKTLNTPKLTLEDVCEYQLPLCYEPPSPAFFKPCISTNIPVPEVIPSIYNFIPFGGSPSDYYPEESEEDEMNQKKPEMMDQTEKPISEEQKKPEKPISEVIGLIHPLDKKPEKQISDKIPQILDKKLEKKHLEDDKKPEKTISDKIPQILDKKHLERNKKPEKPILEPAKRIESPGKHFKKHSDTKFHKKSSDPFEKFPKSRDISLPHLKENTFKKPFPVLSEYFKKPAAKPVEPPMDSIKITKKLCRKPIEIVEKGEEKPIHENLNKIQVNLNKKPIHETLKPIQATENLKPIQTIENLNKIQATEILNKKSIHETLKPATEIPTTENIEKKPSTSSHFFKRPADDLDKPNYFKKIAKLLEKSEHLQKNVENSFEKLSLNPAPDGKFKQNFKHYKIPKRFLKRDDRDVLILHPDPEDYHYIFNR